MIENCVLLQPSGEMLKMLRCGSLKVKINFLGRECICRSLPSSGQED